MIDFDYAAPETWRSRILSLQMRAQPHKVGGVVYVPEQSAELGSGTLTAEQVRHASHGHYKLRMVRDVDGFDVPQVTFDWQAIADELNAELGSGTCDAIFDKDYYVGINGVCESLKCSSCGNPLSAKFRHCPWCGARIRKVVDEC